jgi:phosphoglycerate kinase
VLKLPLIDRVDILILGGGIANTFLFSQGYDVGQSLFEREEAAKAKDIVAYALEKNVKIILPKDAVTMENTVRKINEIHANESIVDIGPETQALFGSFIHDAKTLLWNGPVGLVEDPRFTLGTEFLYYAIAQNDTAQSLVGGGDTIAVISKKNYIDKITWVSTGGGAMIEFVEKGTLPGLTALASE